MSPRPRRLLAFSVGLVLGAGAAWAFLREAAASGDEALATGGPGRAASASVSVSRVPPPPPLVLPPLLDDAEATEALDAFLALPPLDPKAPEPEVRERLDRLHALLTLLPPNHFARLLDALAPREGGAEARLRRTAFEVWTERDAPAAARWALALAPTKVLDAPARIRLLNQAVFAWARADFGEAYAWALALGDQKLAADLRNRLLAQLAASDPRQALALAGEVGDAEQRRLLSHSIFTAWSQRDPIAAVKTLGPQLLAEKNPPWQIHEVIAKWIAKEPAAAVDWALAQNHDPERSHLSPLHNAAWNVAGIPGAATAFLDVVQAREDIPHRGRIINSVLGRLSRDDPDAALAWLEKLPDAAVRSDHIENALHNLTEKPEAFLALARRLPESPARDQKIAQHLSAWSERDPDAAFAWLEQAHDPAIGAASRLIEAALIGQLAATDPAAAQARWQSLPDDSRVPAVAAEIAARWAKNDPASATRWLAENLPAMPASPSASEPFNKLQQISEAWARRDPAAFLAWAEAIPAGHAREYAAHAISGLYVNYAYQNEDPPPRAAFAEHLLGIRDDALRERALRSHLHQWLRSDARSARAWMEARDALSPEAEAALLQSAGYAP